MAVGDLHNAFMAQVGGHQINTNINTPQTDNPKLNWIQNNLNNIGGGGGAVAGGLTGAAAGTAVLPGIGTLLGAILGAGVGGMGGGRLGEMGKQSALGNANPNGAGYNPYATNEINKQGFIQGGLGLGAEAGGQALGHVLAPVLGKVAGTGVEAGAKAGDNILTKAGDQMLASQANVTRGLARSTKLPETFGTLADYGVKNIKDFQPIADQVTGGSGILSKATRAAYGSAAPIEVGATKDAPSILNMAKDLTSNPNLGNQGSKIFDYVKNSLIGGPSGRLGNLNASDAYGMVQDLQGKAAELTRGKIPSMVSGSDRAAANVYNSLASELENRLASGGADAAVANNKVITPQVLDQLRAVQPNNKAWATFVDQVANAKTAGELRSLQAPFVRGGQIGTESALQSGLSGSTLGNVVKGGEIAGGFAAAPLTGGASIPAGLLAAGLGTDTGKVVAGSALRGLGGIASGAGGAVGGLADALGRAGAGNIASQAAARAPQALKNNQGIQGNGGGNLGDSRNQPASQNYDPAQPGYSGAPGANSLTGALQSLGGASQPAQGFYSVQQFQADAQRDPKHLADYLSLLKYSDSQAAAANKTAGGSAPQLKAINGVQNASQALDNISKQFAQSGGGRGVIGGWLANEGTKANINPALKSYNSLKRDAVLQISTGLFGATAGRSPANLAEIQKSLPDATDSPATVQYKINDLKQRLISVYQDAVNYGQTGAGTYQPTQPADAYLQGQGQ